MWLFAWYLFCKSMYWPILKFQQLRGRGVELAPISSVVLLFLFFPATWKKIFSSIFGNLANFEGFVQLSLLNEFRLISCGRLVGALFVSISNATNPNPNPKGNLHRLLLALEVCFQKFLTGPVSSYNFKMIVA